MQQTCSNAVPTTCQQDVFTLLVPSLLTSCQRLVDNSLRGCWGNDISGLQISNIFWRSIPPIHAWHVGHERGLRSCLSPSNILSHTKVPSQKMPPPPHTGKSLKKALCCGLCRNYVWDIFFRYLRNKPRQLIVEYYLHWIIMFEIFFSGSSDTNHDSLL
jgi:hypothetical protein